VADCVHEDTHLGGMALAHARHVGGGADGAAGDQDALLSVRYPQELDSLKHRGGGVPEHAAFVWGLGESDGGGCAGDLSANRTAGALPTRQSSSWNASTCESSCAALVPSSTLCRTMPKRRGHSGSPWLTPFWERIGGVSGGG
jgi:hypothetical protein